MYNVIGGLKWLSIMKQNLLPIMSFLGKLVGKTKVKDNGITTMLEDSGQQGLPLHTLGTSLTDVCEEMPIANYRKIGADLGKLCAVKNTAYGSSYNKTGDILKVLYPNGVSPEQYTDMLAIARVLDKLFRIATDKDAFGESPWRDIAGYSILGEANHQNKMRLKETDGSTL
jgi:hypothetical protein